MPIHVLEHPLAKVQLSIFRDRNTGAADFRQALKKLAGLVGLEATARLPLAEVPNLQSPLATFTGHIVASRVGLAPILRSGVGMEDALLALLPDAPVYHLGLFREPVSLQPVEYYSKLPDIVPVDTLFILDPMIATGNTAIAAIRQIEEWGLPTSSIKLLSVIASASAVASITETFPDVEVYVAGVDEQLTTKGYVLPGCGDVGNRLYGTS